MRRPLCRVPDRIAVGVAVVGVVLSLSRGGLASAEPPVETVLAERTNPAVQAVIVEYTATTTLGHVLLSNEAWKLFDRGIAKVRAGEMVGTRAVAAWVFDHIRENPTRYFRTVGKTRTVKMSSRYVGSGFIATESGYVVTARHVVTPDAEIRTTFVRDGTSTLAQADGDALVRLFRKWDLSRSTQRDIRASVAAFDRAKAKVRVSAPKVSVLLGVAALDGSRVGQAQPAEVVYRSASDLGADVAVLRMRVAAKLPALALAVDVPGQGSQVYVNCFPAAATWTKGMSEAARLQPTLSGGQITAVKASTGGISLLQTNAVTSPGCSGGPALNAAGEVVGILVSGAVDARGIPVGQNYVQPVGLIAEALSRSAADITPSPTTILYNQALTDYHQDYFRQALEEFRAVQALYPQHAYVGQYIADSQAAISDGRDKTPPPPPTISLSVGISAAMAVLVLVLVGSGILVWLLIRRRTSQTARPEGDATPQPTWPHVQSASDQDPTTAPVDHSQPGGQESEVALMTTVPGVHDPEGQGVDLSDAEAPDTFPAWRPIDFVPAYPPTETGMPAGQPGLSNLSTQPPSEDPHP